MVLNHIVRLNEERQTPNRRGSALMTSTTRRCHALKLITPPHVNRTSIVPRPGRTARSTVGKGDLRTVGVSSSIRHCPRVNGEPTHLCRARTIIHAESTTLVSCIRTAMNLTQTARASIRPASRSCRIGRRKVA